MDAFDYYKAPPQEIFDEIKKASIEIWKTYDNQFGYVDEKVNRIEPITNIKDNAWTIVAMFDSVNQQKLLDKVSDQASEMIFKARGY